MAEQRRLPAHAGEWLQRPAPRSPSNTFAVDPNFRVGYAQIWQLSIQRDLPAALQLTATYLGVKGTRGVQQFLPNTYPIGAANPCPACPSGFVYQSSGGDSTRQAGQVQLRRRLRSGFTASLLYTFSKSIDDDALLGGQGHVLAGSQTQRPPRPGLRPDAKPRGRRADRPSERAPHRCDRAELARPACRAFAFELRSTSPAQSAGAIHEWRRPGRRNADERLARQAAQGVDCSWPRSVVGTGLPETPVYLAAVPGTGFTGTIRPDPTGAPIYIVARQVSTSTPPLTPRRSPAQWGTAGRNSITGPEPVQPR